MVKQGIQIYARAKPTKQKLTGVSMLIGKELFVTIFLSLGFYLVKFFLKISVNIEYFLSEAGIKVVILLY